MRSKVQRGDVNGLNRLKAQVGKEFQKEKTRLETHSLGEKKCELQPEKREEVQGKEFRREWRKENELIFL